jgi:hypothetical protein
VRFRKQKSSLLAIQLDMNVVPTSYDVCWVLAWADLQREALGLQSIGVTITDLRDDFVHSRPEGHPDYVSPDQLRWRIEHLIAPIVRLHRSVSYVCVCKQDDAWRRQAYLSRYAVSIGLPDLPTMYREVLATPRPQRGFGTGGHAREVLAVLLGSEALENIVSITIRESTGGRVRNSKIDQWNLFAEELRDQRFTPVFVPDTDRWADEAKFSGVTLSVAALNLNVRMALYETAKMNMFVNSGPAALCYLTPEIPCLIFKILASGERLSSEEVLSNLGFTIGQSPRFAKGYQKWVWEDDAFDVISREFGAFRKEVLL